MTKQTTHTPGPWKAVWHESVQDEKKANWHVVDSQGYGFMHVDSNGKILIGRDNARLIAAAPELLEALQSLHDRLLDCELHQITAREAYDSFYRGLVKEAIAKATGQS